MTAWLSIIGIGEDGLENISPAARQAIENATLLVGGDRHLAMLPEDGRERKTWPSPLMILVEEILARRGENICILATGDPMHYGIGVTFAKRLPAEELAIFPAVSAFSLAAARLGWDLSQTEQITLHGRPLDLLITHLAPGNRILALSDSGETPSDVAQHLQTLGLGEAGMSVLEHMGGPSEKTHHGIARDFRGKTFRDLNTIALQCPKEPAARVFSRTPGLPDDAFDHDGQITKQEIRAATLSALAPFPGELIWDVGAGSGSIAIEWVRCHQANRAYAIEPREDRQALIEANCRKLGVPQVKLIKGTAPDALSNLSAPDAIFVGGGLSHEGVFDSCWSSLKQGGRLVANAVTIEGELRLFEIHNSFGGTLTRHNISRAEKIGGFTSWKPFRQVTQIRLVKE
ncbi:precorrin-6y C5,15-methyltransferase (decarboxylating) subunit CbiE [Sneathiella sp. CAU 1612]|uniref:Precorrin-6y C5,15-methyltransferase (Decarboxylating) subunit CbiE n=1 Tax=Sneathiella sedimenti TaxID=2816034 RepID=A0ABS3F6M1_9PROT|nr:precorrin-6y C5,15-methyltransferase (decarboxylating) subunit CbiE [Sneathiella sedimenti]MBO0334173.1 precorrin-6y C5,15-methyltransferase (decarboxylating) subunit CbiE [Sneathiella sedimenti]